MKYKTQNKILYLLLIILSIAVIASCGEGEENSDNSTGNTNPPAATITAQPVDQSVVVGAAATFSVTASNATGYQWQRSIDGGTTYNNLSGATQASYTTPVTTIADDGQRFRVVVAGAANSVISSAVMLTVTAAPIPPLITVHPADQTVTAGQDASFSVTATGTALSYQWQRSTDGGASFSDLTGATGTTLTHTAVLVSDSGHLFHVVVSNSVGSVASNAAILTVIPAPIPPLITVHPVDQTVTAG